MPIFFDTETTGLPKANAAPLSSQPQIIEFYAIRVDDNYNVIGEVDHLINPGCPVPAEITRITGITDEDLVGKPSFLEVLPDIHRLFLGEETIVAHNCSFDIKMLAFELRRLEMEFKFPWPRQHLCTVLGSSHLKGKRLKLRDLHEIATGKPHEDGAHRARHDVFALIRCFKWLRENGHM